MTGVVNIFGAKISVETEREGNLTVYRVEVWGTPPNDYSRVYTMRTKTPEEASSEAINRFTAEISALVGDSF
jgi:hypothetical protein